MPILSQRIGASWAQRHRERDGGEDRKRHRGQLADELLALEPGDREQRDNEQRKPPSAPAHAARERQRRERGHRRERDVGEELGRARRLAQRHHRDHDCRERDESPYRPLHAHARGEIAGQRHGARLGGAEADAGEGEVEAHGDPLQLPGPRGFYARNPAKGRVGAAIFSS